MGSSPQQCLLVVAQPADVITFGCVEDAAARARPYPFRSAICAAHTARERTAQPGQAILLEKVVSLLELPDDFFCNVCGGCVGAASCLPEPVVDRHETLAVRQVPQFIRHGWARVEPRGKEQIVLSPRTVSFHEPQRLHDSTLWIFLMSAHT
ncbi:hypothetical protein [Streptomyces sp. NPDC050534]|uniref:hypothetical protein n=1 Tax=Streptomyces sp. NPDC050534 TaxID=3365625 RepID=UPI0037BB0905